MEHQDGEGVFVTSAMGSVLNDIGSVVPGLVEVEETAQVRSINGNASTSKVKMSCDFNGSWLAKPKPRVPGDTIGVWQKTEKFPSSTASHLPKEFDKKYMPKKIPVAFPDTDMEEFFTANNFLSNNKVTLPSSACDPDEITVSGGVSYGAIDVLSRKALSDCFTTDTLLDSANNFVSDILTEWDKVSEISEAKAYIEAIKTFISLQLSCNLRCKQGIIATLTANKMACRSHVLDSLVGDSQTKNVLKGSNLDGPNLFGDIPESHLRKLEASGDYSRTNYRLRPKSKSFASTSMSTSTGFKRGPGASTSVPPYKRPKSNLGQFLGKSSNKKQFFPENNNQTSSYSRASSNRGGHFKRGSYRGKGKQ